MTADESLDPAAYQSPIGKPRRELTDAEVAEWIQRLELDVAEGLTPWNMKDDVIARGISAEAAQKESPEEMKWRRENPGRVWLTELLDLHRIRHCQPRLWEKIVSWD
jgi:hypothetical protein